MVDLCFLPSSEHLKHHTSVSGRLQLIQSENRGTERRVSFKHKTTLQAKGSVGLTVTDFRVMPWKVPIVSILKLSVSKEEGKQKTTVADYWRLLGLYNPKQNV